jgi:hypothetical protein
MKDIVGVSDLDEPVVNKLRPVVRLPKSRQTGRYLRLVRKRPFFIAALAC